MIIRLLSLLSILVYGSAFATDRYVDPLTSGCSTPTDTDYTPATRSCGTGSELVYNTIAAALAADAPGDNIYVRDAVYPEAINNTIASGPGPGLTSVTNFRGYQGERPTLRPPSYNPTFQACVLGFISPSHSIVVQQFTFDGINCTAGGANVKLYYTLTGAKVTYIRLQNLIIKNTPTSSGILLSCDNCEILNNDIGNNGDLTATDTNHLGAGIYNHDGIGTLISGNNIHDNSGVGLQNYPDTHQITVSNNRFYHNGSNPNLGAASACMWTNGDTDVVRGNVCVMARGHGIGVAFGNGPKVNTSVDHNSLYCDGSCQLGIRFDSGTGMLGRNNIVNGAWTTKIYNPAGATLTTNLTTGTATSIWNNPSTGDLSLKAASAAIDAGTNIGLPFNGSAPDQGPFETFVPISASMSGTTLDITLGMNAYTPAQGIGAVSPWTVGCTGTGCGAPTVSSSSSFGGASSIIRLNVTGFTCAALQTLTVSYDATVGTVTDSLGLGSSFNQPLFSFSNLSVDNQCNGSPPPSYPSGALIYHKLDGNVLDSSGNGNNGTLTGSPAFVSAKHGQGMQTTAGSTKYDALPWGSGVNPFSQALTLCSGIWITPGTEGTVNFIALGASTGTNQRFHIAGQGGTWRLAAQGNNSGTASDLAIVPGWNFVCVLGDGAGHLTLYNNNKAATSGSGVRTVTSYALASNIQIGSIPGNTSGASIFDEVLIWTSSQTIADIYNVWEPPVSANGTFSQVAHQFQKVYTLSDGTIEAWGANNADQLVNDGGSVAIEFQVDCDNVTDCLPTSFALYYSTDGINFNNPVPDIPTSDGVYFPGLPPGQFANVNVTNGALTGALTNTNGPTQYTSAAIPIVDLTQNSSLTLRYIVSFSSGQVGQVRYFKLKQQTGDTFTGTYTPSTGAKVTIISPLAGLG